MCVIKKNIFSFLDLKSISRCTQLNKQMIFWGIVTEFLFSLDILNETIHKKLPKLDTTRRNYSLRLVNTIKSEMQGLSDLIQNVIENPDGWENDTINIAHRYHIFFEELSGNFLLNIFAQVFSYTDVRLIFFILAKK